MNIKSLKTEDTWKSTPDPLKYWLEDCRDESDESTAEEQTEVMQLQHQLLAWGFRQEFVNLTHSVWLYPEFSHRRYYESWGDGIIVPINGKRWKVMYEVEPAIKNLSDIGDYHPQYGESIRFEMTDEPETEYSHSPSEDRYLSFFGQPAFIQNKVLPVHDFQPAKPLFQWENEWGDCGNENVFLSCDLLGDPAHVFLEYSCS